MLDWLSTYGISVTVNIGLKVSYDALLGFRLLIIIYDVLYMLNSLMLHWKWAIARITTLQPMSGENRYLV